MIKEFKEGDILLYSEYDARSKIEETTFTDYLKIVSPDDRFGIRADLMNTKTWKHLNGLVNRYIEFKNK